jgi:predicted permease
MRVPLWLDLLRRDFTYAFRRLARNPAFTIVATLSLALGIGANTAAFGVLYAVLLRTLPVADPASLALVSMRYTGTQYSMSYPAYQYLRDYTSSPHGTSSPDGTPSPHGTSSLDGLIAFRDSTVNVSGAAGASASSATERATGMLVSGNYFDVLGVEMAIGTPIRPDDDLTPGGGGARGPVAVLSDRFWTRRFQRDPAVIGQTLKVNGQPLTVVGVAPPGFEGTRVGALPDLFMPMMFARAIFDVPNWLTGPGNNWLRIIGRIRRGVTAAQAEADMSVAFRQFNQEFIVPGARTEQVRQRALTGRILLEPGGTGLSEMRATLRPALFILMGLVGVVLLLACVNVANLLVARAERYHRDTAIHLALGASRARLWAQQLVEAVVLGAGGVAMGLVLASWMRGLLGQLVPANQKLDLSMDARVLGLSIALGVGATLGLTIVTGWQNTRRPVLRALKGEDVAGRLWLRKGLIVGQLALSIVVLVAAALFGQTLRNLRLVDPGFVRDRVLIASMDPSGYTPARQAAFYARLLDEVRAAPGVVSAALANESPLDNSTFWTMRVPGVARTADVEVSFVSRDYFSTMGVPILRGRDIDPRRDAVGEAAKVEGNAAANVEANAAVRAAAGAAVDAAMPVIVNEAFVRQLLAEQRGQEPRDPIGARVTGNGSNVYEIIGVVKDSATAGLRGQIAPMLYVPLERNGFKPIFVSRLVLHVRTAVPPAALADTVRAIVRRGDPDVPVFDVRTIDQQLDRVMGRELTFAKLSSTFGLLALVLSAVGLYGVIAYAVSRRTRELGIRLALGAGPHRIVYLVLEEAALLVLLGIAIGLPLAYALGEAIGSLLYNVQPADAASLAIAVTLLLAVAALSAWMPARRAARVDPLTALRHE